VFQFHLREDHLNGQLSEIIFKKTIPVCLSLLFLIIPSLVVAQNFKAEGGNIRAGSLEIHPSLQVRSDYSNNVYQSYGGLPSSSGFISTITPALKLLLPVARHEFFAEYKADFNLYSVDSETNYIQQRAGGGAKLLFGRNLDLAMTYYYTASEIPRLAKSQFGSEINGFNLDSRPYSQNDFKGVLGWSFSDRWRAEGLFNYFNTRYKNSVDFYSNYDSPTFGGRLFYRFTNKMSAFGEYTYANITYPDSSIDDNRNQFIYAGLNFDPTAKLKGEMKIGYQSKKYEQSQEGRTDFLGGTAIDVNLTQQFTDFTALKLLLNRRINEDVTTNAPYTENKISLELKHYWSRNEKVSATLRGGYSTLNFDGKTEDIDGSYKNRDDRRWEFGVGVGYDFRRWLTLNLGYQYIDNDSNFINYDFKENRISLSIWASF
jgi:polysaccharide biosynthesis protein VpsM